MSPAKTLQRSDYGSWAEIDLSRFRNNLNNIKNLSAQTQVMAVIKANGYGHGLLEMARAIQNQVTYLAVSSVSEVLELRENGIETPVFLFGRFFGEELLTAVNTRAALSVSSYQEAQEIAQIADQTGRSVTIHIKIDTGMGRLGIPEHEAFSTIQKIALLKGLSLEGIFTHFPTAEREDGFTEAQFQKFGLLIEALESKGISFALRHASNSAASLKLKSPILNLIRPGLILYGIPPVESASIRQLFPPVLSLKSRIILLKQLEPGESVGYGREYPITERCTIATLPIGYSHGYPVHLSSKSFVLFNGKRYPVAGRVSMDYLCVNLGNTEAHIGDEVTLIGEDGGDSLRAEDLAQWAGTIPYEIVTRLSSRLPRIYLD